MTTYKDDLELMGEIQALDEIGGPDTPADYISALEVFLKRDDVSPLVKSEIEKRINTAKGLEDGKFH